MKRFLAVFCSILMMLTSVSVLADAPTVTEITEAGTAEIGIGAEVPSNWKVTLPTKVSLIKQEDDTYKGTFDKIVSGDLSSDKMIKVEPVSNSIIIADSAGGKSDVTGTLTDEKTSFIYTDLSDTGRECIITSPILTAGTWEGTVSYNIDIVGSDYLDPGFYLADGSLLRSLSVEEVNNYGASYRYEKSLPSYLGLTNDKINTITKVVVPEMEAPANCSYMFYDCRYVEEIDVAGFDTKNVTDMDSMFWSAGYSATTFNISGLSNWNTENVTGMRSMFSQAGWKATTFNLDLSNWNTENVTSMNRMFLNTGYDATTFNLDLSNWNVSNVTHINYMFSGAGRNATTFNISGLSNWNTEKVIKMNNMFNFAGENATTWNIGNLSNWDTSDVTDMSYMFDYAGRYVTTFDIGDLSGWNTENVTSMNRMFESAGQNATTTFNIGDISGWNTENVTDMNSMFSAAGYKATYSLDLSGWNVNKVTEHNSFNYMATSKVKAPIWVN